MRRRRFEGDVVTRWLVHAGEDRRMRLEAPFEFIDSRGRRWQAIVGDEVDGASIPTSLWSNLIGTPFVGDYRRASVVHDVACEKKLYTSKQAHRMFFEAMLEDGTPKPRAIMMYIAVRVFGPRWGRGGLNFSLRGAANARKLAKIADKLDFDNLEKAIDSLLDSAPD